MVFVIGAEMTRRASPSARSRRCRPAAPREHRRGAEQRRLRPQQVLLLAVLRLPVQELLRPEPAARRKRATGRWSLARAASWPGPRSLSAASTPASLVVPADRLRRAAVACRPVGIRPAESPRARRAGCSWSSRRAAVQLVPLPRAVVGLLSPAPPRRSEQCAARSCRAAGALPLTIDLPATALAHRLSPAARAAVFSPRGRCSMAAASATSRAASR